MGERIKNAATGKPTQKARIAGFKDWTTAVAWSPDSKTLAIGSYESIRIWNIKKKADVKKLRVPSGYVYSLVYSKDGKDLYVGGYQSIYVYNVETGKRTRKIKGHRGYVTELILLKDGTELLSSSDDLTVRHWNLKETDSKTADSKEIQKTEIRKFEFTLPVYGIAVSPDETQIAVALGDKDVITIPGEAQLFDLNTGKLIHKLSNHKRQTTDVAFSSDGQKILSTSLDERVIIHNVETGKATGFFGGHSRPTQCIQVVPETRLIFTGSGGRFQKKNEVKLWDIETGEEFAVIDAHKNMISDISLSPSGSFLATSSYDKSVLIYDVSLTIAASLKKMESEKD